MEEFQIFGSTWWLCEGPPGFWKMRQPRPQHEQSKMSVTVVFPFSEASDCVVDVVSVSAHLHPSASLQAALEKIAKTQFILTVERHRGRQRL